MKFRGKRCSWFLQTSHRRRAVGKNLSQYERGQLHLLWLCLFSLSPTFAEEKSVRLRSTYINKNVREIAENADAPLTSSHSVSCVSSGPSRGIATIHLGQTISNSAGEVPVFTVKKNKRLLAEFLSLILHLMILKYNTIL